MAIKTTRIAGRSATALVTRIACNIEAMQTDNRRHPKWKDVTPLDIKRVTWPAHPTAVRAIDKANPAQAGRASN